MFENILHDIGGIYVYGIISICLFFTFFVGMLLWAFRLKKPYLGSMRDLPLDGGEIRDTPLSAPETGSDTRTAGSEWTSPLLEPRPKL